MIAAPAKDKRPLERAALEGATRDARGTIEDRETGLLLTGATGFLGMELLARYLERTDRRVYALVRGADDHEVAARVQRTLHSLFGAEHSYGERVVGRCYARASSSASATAAGRRRSTSSTGRCARSRTAPMWRSPPAATRRSMSCRSTMSPTRSSR